MRLKSENTKSERINVRVNRETYLKLKAKNINISKEIRKYLDTLIK
jgi:post-segregation antitoxin (ccd killing protein)